MKERTIVITVDHSTGNSTVEGINFEGEMCDSVLSKFFAGKVTEDVKKPEYRIKTGTKLTTKR